MNKVLGILIGAGLILGLTLSNQVYAMDGDETSPDRDLNVTSDVNDSQDQEIGEVENETDHDLVAEKEDHDVLHEDHESATAETHESSVAETHDRGTAGETETHTETK